MGEQSASGAPVRALRPPRRPRAGVPAPSPDAPRPSRQADRASEDRETPCSRAPSGPPIAAATTGSADSTGTPAARAAPSRSATTGASAAMAARSRRWAPVSRRPRNRQGRPPGRVRPGDRTPPIRPAHARPVTPPPPAARLGPARIGPPMFRRICPHPAARRRLSYQQAGDAAAAILRGEARTGGRSTSTASAASAVAADSAIMGWPPSPAPRSGAATAAPRPAAHARERVPLHRSASEISHAIGSAPRPTPGAGRERQGGQQLRRSAHRGELCTQLAPSCLRGPLRVRKSSHGGTQART